MTGRKETRQRIKQKKHFLAPITELGKIKVGMGLSIMVFSLLTLPILAFVISQSGSLTDLRNRAAYSDANTLCTPNGACQEAGKICCSGTTSRNPNCTYNEKQCGTAIPQSPIPSQPKTQPSQQTFPNKDYSTAKGGYQTTSKAPCKSLDCAQNLWNSFIKSIKPTPTKTP